MTNNYTVELRQDQWDLIVLAMKHIRDMSLGGESSYGVDKLGRRFLCRAVDEIVLDIQANVPKHEGA